MPEWAIAGRLAVALGLGAAVAWVYSRTNRGSDAPESLPATLVLLSVLIAMVTQVIGDNVARAFSLVGALSIVRFRTVVRDTRDTAFVIFAVVVGMAAGADNYWVGLSGFAICTVAAFAMSRRAAEPMVLTVRAGLGSDLDALVEQGLAGVTHERTVISIGTVKQGTLLEVTYDFKAGGARVEDIVRALNRVEGVQEVQLGRRGANA